jgi:D-arabinitol dehydrogenase (NADP+)
MRAIVYDAPRSFTVAELPEPTPAADEVRLRVEMTGVCGTDVHIHNGRFISRFPLTPGHEVVGLVEELGAAVTAVQPGQRVVANGNSGCGACEECVRGRPLFCLEFTALGVTGPGGFAESMIVPGAQCFPVDEMELEAAVLAEPTACAVHGLDVLDLRPGADVLLFGAGPTGLVLAQLLLHGGAARLTVAAPTAFKLKRARAFGADHTVEIPRDDQAAAVARVRELAPRGFDVVVDATGAAAVSEVTLSLLRDGGTALWYGLPPEEDRVSVSPYEIFRRELTIKGSFAQVDCFPRAVDYLRSGRVRTDGIVTHRFGLEEFGSALTAVREDPTALKAVVVPTLAEARP